jgi:tape measure domain-containing protein
MSNTVEFILRARNEMRKPLNQVADDSRKARNATDDLRSAAEKNNAQMREQAKRFWDSKRAAEAASRKTREMGTSVKQLQERLKNLRNKRNLIDDKDVGTLQKYNREIAYLQAKIKAMSSTGTMTPAQELAAKRARELAEKKSFANRAFMRGDYREQISRNILGGFNVVSAVVLAATAAIGKSVQLGLQQGMDRAKFKNEFGALSGSRAVDVLSGMSGPGLNPLQQGATLMRSGFSLQQTQGLLRRVGDVANGSTESADALVQALAQARKDGKLTQETFEALRSAGFNPLVQIARQTGESYRHLYDRLEQGKIGFGEIEAALIKATSAGGDFAGNMDRLADSTLGKWETAMAKISRGMASVGEAIADKILLPVMNFVSRNRKDLMQAASGGGTIIGTLGAMAGGFIRDRFMDAKPEQKNQRRTQQLVGETVAAIEKSRLNARLSEEQKAKAEEERRQKFKTEQDKLNAISGGGIRNITINVAKMIESITNNFHNDTEQAAALLERQIAEGMVRILQSVSAR